jgi:uncharacterized Rmd1/YagE family protein
MLGPLLLCGSCWLSGCWAFMLAPPHGADGRLRGSGRAPLPLGVPLVPLFPSRPRHLLTMEPDRDRAADADKRRAFAREPKLPEEAAGAKRRPTLLEQAAADDLDQAELELKLESLQGELQAISKKMLTLRRRRKILKSSKGQSKRKDETELWETTQDDEDEATWSAPSRGVYVGDGRPDAKMLPTFTGSIDTFCTAEEYDMDVAFRRLRVWSRGNAKFMESGTVVHVRTGSRWEDDEDDPDVWKLIDADEGDVFVFAYGVVVCWGLTEEQTQELQTVMRFSELRGYLEPEVDQFRYTYGNSFAYQDIEDTLVLVTRPSEAKEENCNLDDDENCKAALERSVLEKLAASHCYAQSARLEPFAESVQQSLEDTRGLAAELAETGAIESQSERDIARSLGRLILDRHSIYLYADVLDAPDVCWEYPELDPLYKLLCKSLELEERVVLLNARVTVVRELLDVLSGELANKHASRLEEIIIWLICFQIIMEFVREIVPFATSWVKEKAALSAATGSMVALQSLTVQSLIVTFVTVGIIMVSAAIFSWLYWWWSVWQPGRWARNLMKPFSPKRPTRYRTGSSAGRALQLDPMLPS